MPKLKKGTIVPTPKEDAAITSAAMSDPDAIPLTDEEWEVAKSTVQRGRPKAAVTKELISLRLSRDVLDRFRATGQGWQTRIDEALKEWMREHR